MSKEGNCGFVWSTPDAGHRHRCRFNRPHPSPHWCGHGTCNEKKPMRMPKPGRPRKDQR